MITSDAAMNSARPSQRCRAKGIIGRNTKHQTPNTKETPNSKHQSDELRFEIWCLRFLWCLVFGFWCLSFAIHGCENPEQLGGFTVQRARFFGQLWFGRRNHAQKQPGFLGFLDAPFDGESEILFREAIVGLAEICRHARSSANDLINQAVV